MKHPLVYTLFSTNGLVLVMVEGKDISLPADLSNLPDCPLGYSLHARESDYVWICKNNAGRLGDYIDLI